MAGLNVGMTNWGNFRGSPEQTIESNRSQRDRYRGGGDRQYRALTPPGVNDEAPRGGRRNRGVMPSMGGGLNVGRTSNMGILPSPMDPYRTYGTVSGGKVTPPSNPYGQNQPIRFTPGGEWGGGGGPIQTGPTNPLQYMQGGGFTGGMTPSPDTYGRGMGALMGYYNPRTVIPNMPQGMNRPNYGGTGQMYSGAGPSLSGGRFRGGLFY